MDQNVKQQVLERLNGTTNVLVTVSANPTVDQLAACIGLTLVLNKLEKHATAVFSGKIPSTLEFLKPEETLEKNTDSLRDFIIALDKSKADKLRYKVEDDVVRIFITPYKTSLSQKDLEFSQGDFNVDVVMALGVQKREDLDAAITAHGRILHDATVVSIMNGQSSNLGALNWQDPTASSLCEMIVDLAETLQPDSFDAQQATALLTGIVAETDRFSNKKTSPRTMSLSAKLMAAGANQQLVAERLQEDAGKDGVKTTVKSASSTPKDDDKGTLRISHEEDEEQQDEAPEKPQESPEEKAVPAEPATPPPTEASDASEPKPVASRLVPPVPQPPTEPGPQISSVKAGNDSLTALQPEAPAAPQATPTGVQGGSKMTFEPPITGGTLTANSRPDDLEPTTDAMSLPNPVSGPMLSHQPKPADQTANQSPLIPGDQVAADSVLTNEPLTKIEQDVASPHAADADSSLDAARDAVAAAAQQSPHGDPLAALGAQPIDMNPPQGAAPEASVPPVVSPLPTAPASAVPSPTDILGQTSQLDSDGASVPTLPTNLVPPDAGLPPEKTGTNGPAAPPPPVPPPLMPPSAG